MSTAATRERLDDALAALGGARAQTLAGLTGLSQAQVDFKPAPGRWSIGEIADHLILAESLYRAEIERLLELARAGRRPYLKRSFHDINVAPLYLPTPILSLLSAPLSMASRLIPDPVRRVVTRLPVLPTRHPDRATPVHGRPVGELRTDLQRSLAGMRTLLAAGDDREFAAMISEHPLTGPSNVLQILGFLALHERRHQLQMERVRSAPRFPAPTAVA